MGKNYHQLALLLAVLCAACERSVLIEPEVIEAQQEQGVGPNFQRVMTADTDAAQLRTFHNVVAAADPYMTVEITQGPFVVVAQPSWQLLFIDFSGTCAAAEDVGLPAFNQQAAPLSVDTGAHFVPEGAVLCVVNNPGDYSTAITGYVPY